MKMKVGVIGTGVMGINHIRVYSELKDIDKVYAFDTDKESALGVKADGLIVCDSVEELLDLVDVVSICVPTRYHADLTKRVIEVLSCPGVFIILISSVNCSFQFSHFPLSHMP